jgi:hypothetical protein
VWWSSSSISPVCHSGPLPCHKGSTQSRMFTHPKHAIPSAPLTGHRALYAQRVAEIWRWMIAIGVWRCSARYSSHHPQPSMPLLRHPHRLPRHPAIPTHAGHAPNAVSHSSLTYQSCARSVLRRSATPRHAIPSHAPHAHNAVNRTWLSTHSYVTSALKRSAVHPPPHPLCSHATYTSATHVTAAATLQ